MCINFRTQGTHTYTVSEEREIRVALQQVLANRRLKFITQNGHFDASWLWFKDRIRVHGHHFDTMLAHHLLYPALPHNLGFICAQYTDQPYYKDDGKEWRNNNDIDTFWRYNVTDCCITYAAYEKLEVELQEQGLTAFYHNHVMKLQPELVLMSVGGVLCDGELKQRTAAELVDGVAEARELCQTAACEALGVVDYQFNPRSTRDLSRLFFTDLKLVGRGSSTDKENRDRMRAHPRTSPAARRTIDAINAYATESKFASVYANSRLDPDGRFRCEYKQTGVMSAPGRLSSAQTMWGTGLNMQNIPERGKGMFIADPGYVLSYYDMAQIEARFVAYLADIPTWKQQFELARLQPGSYDAHCALASEMFKVPYEDVPTYDFEADGRKTIRFTAKRCRHGLNYRMAVDRLATTTGLSIIEAEKAYRLYHWVTPEITVWWDTLAALVRRDRGITTCFGRRWLLLERFEESALDSIVAFEPQSMNGDHTASVIYKCHNDARWPRDARMILNIHDANIAMHRPEDGELVREIMRGYAEEPIYITSVADRLAGRARRDELIVPADFGQSVPDEHGVHRWSTIKKLKRQQVLA
jgi:DNA polymerase I-like protein with 3'-5' exonuclease and polymerase domains